MLGENIRKYRKAMGLTLKQLGEEVGYAENTVSQWERNLREPDLDTLTRLTEILEVPLSALLFLNKRRGRQMEIVQMLILSTAHVSRETMYKIEGREIPIVIYDKGEYGWVIPITEDLLEEKKKEIPSDLYGVLEFSQKHGCIWVMFDRDYDTIDGLPEYDW